MHVLEIEGTEGEPCCPEGLGWRAHQVLPKKTWMALGIEFALMCGMSCSLGTKELARPICLSAAS